MKLAMFISVGLITIVAQYGWADSDADQWPRVFESDGSKITIYQPQVESWNDNRLEERAAVSISKSAGSAPVFGALWLTARTEVDKTERMVSLEDINITKVGFPSAPQKADDYLRILRRDGTPQLKTISLDRLRASLAITTAESRRKVADIKNDPPVIYYSTTPAVLVLIDGPAVLRDTDVSGLQRVINTRALLVLSKSEGVYYLSVANHWLAASSLDGPWTNAYPSDSLMSSLNTLRESADNNKQIDLLNDPDSDIVKSGIAPKVYSSSKPAELLQTSGTAQFSPITGTELLYVQNTPDNIFMDTRDQHYYITLSGRWFRAKALNDKWYFIAAKDLPPDFAKIPDSHPKSDVLASVPGTPDAEEAAITNEIPQTATVERSAAQLTVNYDGSPKFVQISGTTLQYAPNTPTPVIRVTSSSYYAVENGVWFMAPSSEGPWSVATQVPQQIYSIPPSSPIYNVTYVYVYDSTPQYVYVGYQPGYLGSYVTADGVVVYGTGYYYHPWINRVWVGYPATYGFGLAWGFGFGFGFHAGNYGPPIYHPWWGPWRDWHHEYRQGYPVTINHVDVYRHWGPTVINRPVFPRPIMPRPIAGRPGFGHPESGGRPGFGHPGFPTTVTNPRPGFPERSVVPQHPMLPSSPSRQLLRNNVYADHEGNIYRHNPTQGWQRYNGQQQTSWQSVPRTPQPTRMASAPSSSFNLDRERVARDRGDRRVTQLSQPARFQAPAPAKPRAASKYSGKSPFGR